jgi:hypothetical protein
MIKNKKGKLMLTTQSVSIATVSASFVCPPSQHLIKAVYGPAAVHGRLQTSNLQIQKTQPKAPLPFQWHIDITPLAKTLLNSVSRPLHTRNFFKIDRKILTDATLLMLAYSCSTHPPAYL